VAGFTASPAVFHWCSFGRAVRMFGFRCHPILSGRLGLALAAFSLFGALALPARPQNFRSRYQAQYESESDPVRRAKILANLGPLEIAAARADIRSEREEQALAVLQQYNDEVRKTAKALTAMGVDAERRPAGFRELQISLRESLRRLDDLMLALPVDEWQWFPAVQFDLSAIQNLLLDALFPRKPSR
jgi:hypothetical protein